jgi:hypothetical protein
MATKEDILEQLVEEYLIHRGYFVRHNIKFKPDKSDEERNSRDDSVPSDIDVIGYNPNLSGADRVWAVSCKSWQGGLRAEAMLDAIRKNKIVSGKVAWKGFRELVKPKWARAFRAAVKSATGQDQFTYVLAVAHIKGEKRSWEQDEGFREQIGNNPLKIITVGEIVTDIFGGLTTTPAGSEVGRLLQLLKAAGITPPTLLKPKS